ncbi:MAG TPA: electron transfer flavoprotein subunit beta/FixA family protein [Geomonas sp.]|nr:electron transfer flavoprotein subunit beta/FixA family protein [Geomonas sp.]
MNILVCIKQVPDMESRFKVNGTGDWYDEGDLAYRINEYDEYAIEQAVQLKEQLGNQPEITVLSIGADRVADALKKALAMGADKAVHIQDPDSCKKDPWQIADIIVSFARDKNFDIIFTGMQSQDRGSAQVGVMVGELLDLNCATTLVGFEYQDGAVTAKRELEGGVKSVVKLPLPAVVTCQLGLNVPRYPTLPNIMKAKKKELLGIPASTLLKEQPAATTEKLYPPVKSGGGIVLEGDLGEMADRLLGILKEKTTVMK